MIAKMDMSGFKELDETIGDIVAIFMQKIPPEMRVSTICWFIHSLLTDLRLRYSEAVAILESVKFEIQLDASLRARKAYALISRGGESIEG